MLRALDPKTLRQLYDRLARRYDAQHAVLTTGADGRGRRALVRAGVQNGNRVLDAGGGTGSTALLAARRTGPRGRVIVLDQSSGMLAAARRRTWAAGVQQQVGFVVGDIQAPPVRPVTFDVVLSTYSMCPLVAPSEGADALYWLVRAGGCLAVAHSTEPVNRATRWIAARVERLPWRRPGLSMGCRAVSVLPHLRKQGAVVETRPPPRRAALAVPRIRRAEAGARTTSAA